MRPRAGMKLDWRFSASVMGVKISYLRPRLMVSREVARQSSWMYTFGSCDGLSG